MIDFKYAERLSETIMKNTLGNAGRFDRPMIEDFDNQREEIVGTVIVKLWDQLLSNCQAYDTGAPLYPSEKAIASIIRKGVDRKSISMNGTTAYITLQRLSYRIDKEGHGFSSRPCVHTGLWYSMPMRWITMPGDDFAEFMMDFDSIAGMAEMKLDSLLLERKAQAMQYTIICQTVGELGKQLLKPHGIYWQVDTDFTDSAVKVRFRKSKHEGISETIALDRLSEVFAGIPDRMRKQPRIKEVEPERPRIWDTLFTYDDNSTFP